MWEVLSAARGCRTLQQALEGISTAVAFTGKQGENFRTTSVPLRRLSRVPICELATNVLWMLTTVYLAASAIISSYNLPFHTERTVTSLRVVRYVFHRLSRLLFFRGALLIQPMVILYFRNNCQSYYS